MLTSEPMAPGLRNRRRGENVDVVVKRFEKFTDLQIKKLLKHLASFDPAQPSASLHQIRVDIKRIKAILEVTGFCDHRFRSHQHFRPFRTIFRRAGEIREPMVIHQLCQHYQVPVIEGLYIVDLDNLTNRFAEDVPQFVNIIKTQRTDLKNAARHVTRKELERYVAEKKREIKSQLHPKPKFSAIHKTRKSIKEIICLSAISMNLGKKKGAFYERMESAIGRFHDRQMLIDLLKKGGQTNAEAYDAIKTECRNDKVEIRKLAKDYY